MKDMESIQEAAKGLRYISETDHPFEVQEHPPQENIPEQLLSLYGRAPGTTVEKQTLEYFFRNMVKIYPGATAEEEATAKKFKQLQELLQQKLTDIAVYRLGEVAIDAVIVGKLSNGNLVTLRTKLVET